MSDATLPPPRSSPRPETKGKEHPDDEASHTPSLHRSSSVMGDGAEGSNENRASSKQRRKRTRPEDQAILEAEYKRNPKPNKAARADIVEKVTLNEKEVQIWFQNRRQINRRKSRPLLPHEIAAFGLGGMTPLSSDPISASSGSSQGDRASSPSPRQEEPINSQEWSSSQEKEEYLDPRNDEEGARDVIEKEQPILEKEESSIPLTNSIVESRDDPAAAPSSANSSFSENVSKSFSSTPGYLSNRWNSVHVGSSFSAPSSAQAPKHTTPRTAAANEPNSCPERDNGSQSSSRPTRVRLSMSLDGKAELISTDVSPSPSPPRRISPRPSASATSFMQQSRSRTLQRSQSALPLSFPPRDFTSVAKPSAPRIPRLPSGSSRDTRTWEFCCDSDARDELTAQAENESNGSALAAISLLRSTSNSALKSNNNKRNAPSSKHDANTSGKKPKLGRATSSLARLQTPAKVLQDRNPDPKDGLMRSPSGDSDKENWTPTENGANTNPRRHPLPSGKTPKQPTAVGRDLARTALGENNTIPTHAINFGAANKRRRKAKDLAIPAVFEDLEAAATFKARNGKVGNGGEEVKSFMQSGEISPSKAGDLDCVQGLLSLSQGAWR